MWRALALFCLMGSTFVFYSTCMKLLMTGLEFSFIVFCRLYLSMVRMDVIIYIHVWHFAPLIEWYRNICFWFKLLYYLSWLDDEAIGVIWSISAYLTHIASWGIREDVCPSKDGFRILLKGSHCSLVIICNCMRRWQCILLLPKLSDFIGGCRGVFIGSVCLCVSGCSNGFWMMSLESLLSWQCFAM